MKLLHLSPVLMLCATTSLSADVLFTSFENLPVGTVIDNQTAFTSGGMNWYLVGSSRIPAHAYIESFGEDQQALGMYSDSAAHLRLRSISEVSPADFVELGFAQSVIYIVFQIPGQSELTTCSYSDFSDEGGLLTLDGIDITLTPVTQQGNDGWQWQVSGTIDYFQIAFDNGGVLDDVTVNIVPEPAAVSLMLLGLAALRRR